jgi:hypothetical protein
MSKIRAKKKMGKSQIRTKKIIAEIVACRGKTQGEVMRENGLSDAYSKNPKQFLNTKTAQELMEEYLPDEMIAQRHNELANAGAISHYTFPAIIRERVVDNPNKKVGGKIKAKKPEAECITDEEIKSVVESVPGCKLIYIKYDTFQGGKTAYYQAPDSRSRKDAIDMVYKLKGAYAAEKIELTKRKYQDLSNAELAALEKKLIDSIKNRK